MTYTSFFPPNTTPIVNEDGYVTPLWAAFFDAFLSSYSGSLSSADPTALYERSAVPLQPFISVSDVLPPVSLDTPPSVAIYDVSPPLAFLSREETTSGVNDVSPPVTRESVGLGTLAEQNADNVLITGGEVSVVDDPYNAGTWNGSTEVPTKNAVRDKIESLTAVISNKADLIQPVLSITSNVTLAIADVGKYILFETTGGTTLTIPSNATAAIPIGALFQVLNFGGSPVTIARGAGVALFDTTVTNADVTLGFTKWAWMRKVGTDLWSIWVS